MLFRLEDRFVQIEVDEEGHEDRSCADEDSRLELIAADVGLPGLVLRLNPDGAAATAAVEAFLNEPPPEGVRVVGLPASWWDGRTPSNGILCAPSASGKTVLLVSMILSQYRGCFERVYIMSNSIDMDPQWDPVKEYIRKDLGVNTDREQCWWSEWDEGALRQMTPAQERALRYMQRQDRYMERNEPQMLRQFSKMYPSYNLNPLLRRRHQQLVEAQAFNQWLSNRRLQQDGETYADELGRMTS
ncbi:hypothetical protein AK812_SmicGene30603 [Symbiodinium microadriaticum]|uniref:Uncharacterized protein n=1 Tax=Symbiodinium microadriaticum TaxID=2951 RepID=A0A1Q9CYV6_SYMMI|nr:hypothetical protein AK812_SmicGene30603 [Symbiodinium microadriaticum]